MVLDREDRNFETDTSRFNGCPLDGWGIGHKNIQFRYHKSMEIKPTVALRAILVGSIAACAKIAGVMKAAGGAKIGVAAAAMTAAATAAMSSKQEDSSKQPSK